MDKSKTFKDFLEGKENILILNSKPDGDSLGSSIALNYLIARTGRRTRSISLFTIPDYLTFLVDSVLEQKETKKIKNILNEFDGIILVDANEINRAVPEDFDLNDLIVDIPVLTIDHHKTVNFIEADNRFNIIDYKAESTAGIIIDIFSDDDLIEHLDSRVGYYLYAGIASDTDFFSYSNVTSETFERVAIIMKYNMDVRPILLNFRETISLRAFQFIQKYIGNVVINTEKRYSYLVIRKEYKDDYFKLPIVNEATNYLNRAIIRIIDVVDFSFIIKEISDKKCSFAMRIRNSPRSNNIDLSAIAEKFGGGGHRQSAGGIVEGYTIEEFTRKFVTSLENL